MDSFFEQVYEVVRQIPEGRVASYGQLARLVGFAMHASPGMAGGVPCHRVVFKDGSLAPGFAFGGPDIQKEMLREEGVLFADEHHVDMEACAWEV